MNSLHKTPIKIGVNLGSVAQPQFVREGAALTEVSRFQGSLSQDELNSFYWQNEILIPELQMRVKAATSRHIRVISVLLSVSGLRGSLS